MKKKEAKNKRGLSYTFLIISIIIFVGASFFYVSGYIYYHLRRVPDLKEELLVTDPPQNTPLVLAYHNKPKSVSLRVPILMYHYVEYVKNDPGKKKLNIPPNILLQQIRTLKESGYTFMTPRNLAEDISLGKQVSEKTVILSFDDGYEDFYTDVYPILLKEKVPAVAYIITDFLNRPNYLFVSQIQELSQSPLIEIGAHTLNHPWLAGMASSSAMYEITQSKKDLENIIGKDVVSFAYPYGAFDSQTIALVESAGFTNAVSTIPGIIQNEENLYYFYRLRPGYRTGRVLIDYLQQNEFSAY